MSEERKGTFVVRECVTLRNFTDKRDGPYKVMYIDVSSRRKRGLTHKYTMEELVSILLLG